MLSTDVRVLARSFDLRGSETGYRSLDINEHVPLGRAVVRSLGVVSGPGELRVFGALEGRGRLWIGIRVHNLGEP
jgi:hypothetical protein